MTTAADQLRAKTHLLNIHAFVREIRDALDEPPEDVNWDDIWGSAMAISDESLEIATVAGKVLA